MKTYTVMFVDGDITVIEGVEVKNGTFRRGLSVCFGDSVAGCKYWELPFDIRNRPVVRRDQEGRLMVFRCVPVPNPSNPGRFLLAGEQYDLSQDVLVRIDTQAGESGGTLGMVILLDNKSTRIAYGTKQNRANVSSQEMLVRLSPGARLKIVAGGVSQTVESNYVLDYTMGHINFSRCSVSGHVADRPGTTGDGSLKSEDPMGSDSEPTSEELEDMVKQAGSRNTKQAKGAARNLCW